MTREDTNKTINRLLINASMKHNTAIAQKFRNTCETKQTI